MKKKTRKIISLALAAALAVSSVTVASFADESEEVIIAEELDEASSDAALTLNSGSSEDADVPAEAEEEAADEAVETEEIVEADQAPYYSGQNFSYEDDFSLLNQEYNMTDYINLAHTDTVYGNSTTKVELQNKAVFAALTDAESTGTATFTADILSSDVDGDYAGRAFRIYLENEETASTNGVGDAAFASTNIFYHLTDLGSTVYVVTDDTPSVNAASSNGMTAVGSFETGCWYRFVIEVDLDNGKTTTSMYKHSSDGSYNNTDVSGMTLVGTVEADTVTGKSVSLKQIRLVRTAKTYVYYDNLSLVYDSTPNEGETDSTTEATTEAPEYNGFGSEGIDLTAYSYTVNTALMDASDITAASLGAEAVQSAILTVNEDGSATIALTLGAVNSVYTSDWIIYQDGSEDSEAYGAEITEKDEAGNAVLITFEIPDISADGVYVTFTLGDQIVDAYLAIDYSTAEYLLTEGSGIRGDIDGNRVLTANDAASLLAYVLNNEVLNPNWCIAAEIADVAGSEAGDISADDAAAILSKVLNSAYEFKALGESISGSSSGGGETESGSFGSEGVELSEDSYSVETQVTDADDTTAASEAAEAVESAVLTVNEDGSATLTLSLGQITVDGVSVYASDWMVYQTGSTEGSSVAAEVTASDEDGNATEITFTIPDESADGVYLSLTINGQTVNIYLAINYTTAESLSETGESFYWWFDEVNGGSTVSPGTYSAGNGTADVTVVPGLNGESYSAQSNASFEYDGTTHKGYWASNRPDSAANLTTLPTAGSSYYFTLNASGTVTVYNYVPSGKNFFVKDFDESLNLAATNTTASTDSAVNDSYTFAGEKGHTYLVTTGGTNGLRFYGFKFLIDDPVEVPVSVAIGELVDFSKATISFKDVDTGDTYATVVDGQTSITLNVGHTYEISIDDGGIDVDYNGITEFTFTGTESSIDLTLTNVPDVTLSGTITSEDSDNAASVVTSITFTKMTDDSVSYSTEEIDAEAGTYTIQIKPGEYNTSVVTTDGSITNDRVSVSADGDNVNEIYLEQEDLSTLYMYDEISKSSSVVTFSGFSAHSSQYGVSGGVGSRITVPASAGQTLNIVMSYDGEFYVYDNGTGEVVNTGTDLKASYVVSDTATAVTIEVAATGNVASGSSSGYVVSIEYINAALPYVSALSVPGDYDTLNDAVAAIKSMDRPEGEDGRVTITLTADLQEQVIMDADYVTLDGQGQYEVTWYYGVGSAYYSVDSNGYYSESLFRDAYSTRDASGSLWGGVMIVLGDYFKAHDVTFKNTYNYYVTEKEVADGVTPTDGKKQRTLTTDVTASTMRERSNALYTKGNYGEYKNCNILSSQDTLGINGTLSNYTYFTNCTIGGNCDYICGAGTMVFDNCTLQWKTEGASSLGYITAPKIMPYVFRNCTITQDGANYVSSSTGFYGRPWASTADGGAYAIYYKCKTNDLIESRGWYDMSSNSADEAKFYEYNNLASDGSVFMSSRGKDLNNAEYAELLASIEGDAVINGMLGGWVPEYYSYTDE